jgi:uncharacterized membrane protein
MEGVMALSDHEQRLLEEMERNLYNNEADIVTTLGDRRGLNHTAIALGVIIGLVGIITMIVGVYVDVTVVGIIGFAVLFTGVMVAVATPAKKTPDMSSSASAASGSNQRQQNSGSFMDRMNDRWERRQDGAGS